ncbi:hypothetical protein N6H14_27635 [Paenibacillus sp. CC-CFT747]|nr:hypothetical protein N6H14_27635 [Paenibacillus sp. CC-CFT747]
MAGKLGYSVSAWGDGHLLIQKGPYRFDLSKGASSVPLTWFGGLVQEYPIITPPVEANGRLYAHELDLKQLFGYDYDWHNDTRTLNIEYREFLVMDWGVTESLTNYSYKVEAEGFLHGNKLMPELRVGNWLNGSYTSGGASVYQKAENPGALPLYRFGAVTPADLGSNDINVVFSSNQRILYQKSVNVDLTMQTVEPIIDWSGPVGYGDFTELSSVGPSKAYQTTEGNRFEVSGQAAKKIGGGITFKVEKQQENGEYRFVSQISAPFEGNEFHAILPLENGKGLYRITSVSLLSYPRGTGSKEIAKWYVEKP